MQLGDANRNNLIGHEFWLVVLLYKTSNTTETKQWLFATKEEARDYYFSCIPSGDRFDSSESIKHELEDCGRLKREDYYNENQYEYYAFDYGEADVRAIITYKPIKVEKLNNAD